MKNESTANKEQHADRTGVDSETGTADSDVHVVTICELGKLVLLEYTKKEFWISFIERVGGVEAIVLRGIKKVL